MCGMHKSLLQDNKNSNLISTTYRLVKLNILSINEPIREGVRKNSLMCKCVIHNCQSLILIGLSNEHCMVLTNSEIVLECWLCSGGYLFRSSLITEYISTNATNNANLVKCMLLSVLKNGVSTHKC